ncbi:MAG TPA: penicillin acylase family protein [Bryobacteraceae bacterium]|nr:penicillin acylase family protein [Bryobacteraceae bacterium]
MISRACLLFLAALATASGEKVTGLREPVEILRDRWGVPHIYAKNTADLFFAQGWITARDRLYQIDLWRRTGTGKLAEVLGPSAIGRDKIARLLRYRGDWNKEWESYAPDAREIVTAFVNGINAYIKSLGGKRPLECRLAGYDPGLWTPEDVASRMAGLVMTNNAILEVERAQEIAQFGIENTQRFAPPDPFVKLTIPTGLDLKTITADILRDFRVAVGKADNPGEQGSNNWVIDGSMSATGKPLLANDPHRPIALPSLRKTVHLVAPGWNVIGAGEPALPGVALGHNEQVGFGFTIVGIDQQDLYVEKLNPANPNQYLFKGAWKAVEIERHKILVKGMTTLDAELRFTQHGPILYEDRSRNLAFALKWVGAEAGGAGYLAALSVARTKNWKEFLAAMARYKVPSENMVYADTTGNIGWVAAGYAPVRKNWNGLLPVPGDAGAYEWEGYLPIAEMPQSYNPPRHFIATANHKILPDGYTKQLAYDWASPFRFERIKQMLAESKKFTVADFERMQHDVVNLAARRFQAIVRKSRPERHAAIVNEFLQWDARLTADSRPGLIYELWLSFLPSLVFPAEWKGHYTHDTLFKLLEERPNPRALAESLDRTMRELETRLPHRESWRWSAAHTLVMKHPLNQSRLDMPPLPRPGDNNTVNASGVQGATGASWRQILDVADWDRSVMTNVPGESGDPESKHYRDLLDDWSAGRYHPLPFSRKAVEAAMEERILLEPAK